MPRRFQISAAHFEAFSRQQRERFEDDMVVRLRADYPAQTAALDGDALRRMVREGIASAETYHIVLERDVGRYLGLMLRIAPDFDTCADTAWAGEILRRPRLTGQMKLDQIEARAADTRGAAQTKGIPA